MADYQTEDQEIVWISVPLDGATAERLLNLSDVCHAEPVKIAASLLHDILKDDEEANLPVAIASGDVTIN